MYTLLSIWMSIDPRMKAEERAPNIKVTVIIRTVLFDGFGNLFLCSFITHQLITLF